MGVECIKRRTVPGEEGQIQALNGRKRYQSLSLGRVWDSAGTGTVAPATLAIYIVKHSQYYTCQFKLCCTTVLFYGC